MTQKEKTIFVMQAILKNSEKDSIGKEFLFDKLDACLSLQRPEVLLSEAENKVYLDLIDSAKRSGKII